MRSHHRAVHQNISHIGIIIQDFMQILPHAVVAPTGIALVDAVSVAIFLRQEAPLGAAAQNPQHTFHKSSAGLFPAGIGAWVAAQKGVDFAHWASVSKDVIGD